VTVDLNCKIFGLVSATPPAVTATGAIGSCAPVDMLPLLLKRGEMWTANVVVSGKPKPVLLSSLIDVDVDILEGPPPDNETLDLVVDAALAILPWPIRPLTSLGSALVRSLR
jgi:hypothetical protein